MEGSTTWLKVFMAASYHHCSPLWGVPKHVTGMQPLCVGVAHLVVQDEVLTWSVPG